MLALYQFIWFLTQFFVTHSHLIRFYHTTLKHGSRISSWILHIILRKLVFDDVLLKDYAKQIAKYQKIPINTQKNGSIWCTLQWKENPLVKAFFFSFTLFSINLRSLTFSIFMFYLFFLLPYTFRNVMPIQIKNVETWIDFHLNLHFPKFYFNFFVMGIKLSKHWQRK